MMAGMYWRCGCEEFVSQFQMLDSVTSNRSATSRCSIFRPRRRLRMWSPTVSG